MGFLLQANGSSSSCCCRRPRLPRLARPPPPSCAMARAPPRRRLRSGGVPAPSRPSNEREEEGRATGEEEELGAGPAVAGPAGAASPAPPRPATARRCSGAAPVSPAEEVEGGERGRCSPFFHCRPCAGRPTAPPAPGRRSGLWGEREMEGRRWRWVLKRGNVGWV